MQNKLLIFFVDGATWNVLDPWLAEGKLPNLKSIKNRGITGEMISAIPPSTAPAIQVFHTGKNPGRLGIFNVFKEDGSVVSFNDVKEKTFWEILGEHGHRSLIVEMPTTYPIRPFNGVMVSGFLTPSSKSDFTYPKEIREELGDYPAGVEYDHSTSADVRDLRKLLDSVIEISKIRFSAFTRLYKREQPDLGLFYVKSTDVLGHLLWGRRDLLLEYYRLIDSELGEFLALAPDATCLVLSDHGFEDAATNAFFINMWLAQEGYFVRKQSTEYKVYNWLDKNKGVKRIIRKTMEFFGYNFGDRKKSLHKQTLSQASAYLDPMCPVGVRIAPQVLASRPEIVEEIMKKMKNLEHEGRKVFKLVGRREEFYHGPYAYKAPEIICLTNKEYMVYATGEDKVFGVMQGGVRKGDHHSAIEAIFMAAGPAITARPERIKLNMLDIFPTILAFFGIRNVDCDGKTLDLS